MQADNQRIPTKRRADYTGDFAQRTINKKALQEAKKSQFPHLPGRGRPLGSENLVTKTIRQAYFSVLQRAIDGDCFHKWLHEIEDPAKKLEMAMKMTDYFLPRDSRLELVASEGALPVKDRVKTLIAKYSKDVIIIEADDQV